MPDQPRFMLVVSHQLENTPAFDRAAALAKASGAALHIVAFDYLEGLASAGVVNDEAREQMRIDYVERHRQWLEAQARPLRKIGIPVIYHLFCNRWKRIKVMPDRASCKAYNRIHSKSFRSMGCPYQLFGRTLANSFRISVSPDIVRQYTLMPFVNPVAHCLTN